MSNTQFAFVERARVPSRAALQASISALGFELQLDPGFLPFENSGFLPFVLNGNDGAGLEIEYLDTAEVIDGDDALSEIAAGKEVCISMVWHSSMEDLACVMIMSCALAKDFGASISYEGEEPAPLQDLLAATHEILREVADSGNQSMSSKKFDALVSRYFGEVLAEHGFTTKGSKHSTFWRELDGDVFHFILADPMRSFQVYDIKVFFSSPHIDPQFAANFPDSLGIPTDTWCELKAGSGVTHGGSRFPCKDEATFVKGFEHAVKRALLEIAVPYLDQVKTVDQMLALARHPAFGRHTGE